MDAVRTISTGFEGAQDIQARAAQSIVAPRERDGAQSSRPEQSGASVQVNISEEARAAARSGTPSPPPPAPASMPAAPVQTPEAVVRADSVENAGRAQDVSSSGREAVQRYVENAVNSLPLGQSGPSSVRVSA
ncbi:MAG: hypothetical protein LBV29_00080 [Azoarcus sp.]|jgi:hypothetical protein|nr:hypothetical protein [Azoarcus sp.]